MNHRRLRLGAGALALVSAFSAGAAWAEFNLAAYKSLDDCDAALRIYPEEIDVCHCYPNLAERERSWGAVMAHLDERLKSEPGDPRLLYSLGLVDSSRGGVRAENTLMQAADRFAALGEPWGEVQALLSLFFLLQTQSRADEADLALARAESTAETSAQTQLRMFVLYHRGLQAFERGDYVEGMRFYRAVEAEIFPDGHPVLQALLLNALGRRASWEGRHREALEKLEQGAGILHRIGDYSREAHTRYAIVGLTQRALALGKATQQDAEAALDRAREAAARGRNPQVELSLLQDDALQSGLSPDERLRRYQRVLDLARRLRRYDFQAYTLRGLANLTAQSEPGDRAKALRLADEAIEVAHRAGMTDNEAYGYIARALLHRRWGDREAALADWERGLTEIESLRDQQRDDLVQAQMIQRWAFTYYRLLGYIMEGVAGTAGFEDIDRALRVAERLRARAWLETLDQAAASSSPDSDLRRRRYGVLDDLARLQRALLRKDLETQERERILSNLGRVEAEEVSLRAQMARADGQFASLRAPEYPSLAQVQEALRPDEALLSFHIGPEDNISTWLFVLTGQEARAFKLAPGSSIEKAVTLFLGLLDRRDGQEASPAAALHAMLLEPATTALASEIRHLVIVPEGALHRLPIDLLRDDAAGPPLADRYDISIVPSVTAWHRWRLASPGHAPLPVLALADPALDAGSGTPEDRREALSAEGVSLGPLPRARKESAEVARLLGGGSRVVVGEEASESFLKVADPHRYELLHIAAHAVLDDENPQRSAILLKPGSGNEDGLLQIREIVDLDLRDRVVVLSACSSASGTVLQGAGVMGIARGFFHSGARAVVGSLLPLRDDEAAQVMERFAFHLATGASTAAALARARREMAVSGAPAAAWAGLVVLGDGGMVPFPGGVARRGPMVMAALLALTLAAILAMALFPRRRSPSRKAAG